MEGLICGSKKITQFSFPETGLTEFPPSEGRTRLVTKTQWRKNHYTSIICTLLKTVCQLELREAQGNSRTVIEKKKRQSDPLCGFLSEVI
ncbi:MAG: hypothetical protein H6581_17685 [Bacteroidia bacterium]|nr:hypothetical protein [Bacteroidia bacterium]